ncbi:hypothetical protein HAX54_002725 [Datura stramonium]|uniref:Uncharacterized protein n=1 Tax=Datura stramonium TaxID=4076 RepID=A0ABS8T5U0_DATST|nr:hypothetical protein [Datura stramonium]
MAEAKDRISRPKDLMGIYSRRQRTIVSCDGGGIVIFGDEHGGGLLEHLFGEELQWPRSVVGHSCVELWIMERAPIVIAGLRFGCANTLQFLVLGVVSEER